MGSELIKLVKTLVKSASALNKTLTQNGADIKPLENAAPKTAANSSAGIKSIAAGKRPPKPSRKCINDFGVDGSFMLCGDFVESKSYAMEVEIVYVYAPDCNDDFIGYEIGEPYFMISSGIDEVYCSVTNFLENGTIDGMLTVEKRNVGNSLFYAEMDYYGDRMAMYAFARDNNGEKEPFGLCMVYGDDLIGTELEKRFLAALKEAAETYRETVGVK